MHNFVGSWGFAMFASVIILLLVMAYPLITLVGSWVNQDPGLDRHRMTAAKLALLECYLVDVVNEVRRERGEKPVDAQPVVTTFPGHSWSLLRAKVRQAAQAAVTKLS